MKHSDFHIGLEFMGIAGFWWRCTDVGKRTIVAIQLDRDIPHWYSGPPYIAKEVVFDEHEIAACHRTEEEAIRAAVHEHETIAQTPCIYFTQKSPDLYDYDRMHFKDLSCVSLAQSLSL